MMASRNFAAVAACVAAAGCADTRGIAQESGNTAHIVHARDIEFRRPIFFAPEMAALWGDRNEGASGNMEKQTAAAVSALHVHPNDTYAVVLKGRVTHQFEGGEVGPELGPGSYYTLPAESAHISTCLAGGDCLFAYWQPGKLGYTEVKPNTASNKQPGVKVPAESIAYTPTDVNGLSRASLWGKAGAEPTGTLEKLAAGGATPDTSFPVDTHGVVVAGNARVQLAGGNPGEALPVGSYYVIPAGTGFRRSCEPGTECLFLHLHPYR